MKASFSKDRKSKPKNVDKKASISLKLLPVWGAKWLVFSDEITKNQHIHTNSSLTFLNTEEHRSFVTLLVVTSQHNLLYRNSFYRNVKVTFRIPDMSFFKRARHELCHQVVFRTSSLRMRNGRSETLIITKLYCSKTTWNDSVDFVTTQMHKKITI